MPHEQTQQARRQFITFLSGEQDFGADIMCIREIRGWTETTPLPHAPDYVRGVINLRGVVLPVVDLKARLGKTQMGLGDRQATLPERREEWYQGQTLTHCGS